MALFDTIRSRVFDAVNNLYGDTASWTPSAGGNALTAQVLYNEPTDAMSVQIRTGATQYSAANEEGEVPGPFFEYKADDLPGLEASVKQKNDERVVINGRTFLVLRIKRLFDGFNNKAMLEEVV